MISFHKLFFVLGLSACNISFSDDQMEPLDLFHIGQLEHLEELKLKAASGSLIIDEFSTSLKEFVSMKGQSLTKLVILCQNHLSFYDI